MSTEEIKYLYGELDRVHAENARLRKELEAEREKVREVEKAARMLINFIPDGWPMPLGYIQIVQLAYEALGHAEQGKVKT